MDNLKTRPEEAPLGGQACSAALEHSQHLENFPEFVIHASAELVSPPLPVQLSQAKLPSLRRSGPLSVVQFIAFVLPFVGALWQLRGEPLWRSDAAVMAALTPAGEFSGSFSTLLAQVCLHLPLGSHVFRLALPSALACGLAGLTALHLSHILFRKQQGFSRLDPWLALGASLSVSLSLPWLTESSLVGGAAIGAVLALFMLSTLLSYGYPRTAGGSALFGVFLAALFSESRWCAVVLLLSLLLLSPDSIFLDARNTFQNRAQGYHALQGRGALPRLLTIFAGFLLTLGALWLPSLLARSLDLSQELASKGDTIEKSWPLWSPLTWISSIGFLWCGGAIIATVFSLENRRPLIVLSMIVFVEFLAPGDGTMGWSNGARVDTSRLALHLLALGVVAPLGALGLRTLGETAQALRVFAAKPLAALVAAVAIAGCLATAEDSLRTLDETGTAGTQAWTDEALDILPHRALVMTHSRVWGRRLLTAQAQGYRPDLLIVPLSEVAHASTIATWYKREPALEILLRDLSLVETPSERALTVLADKRPVFVQADPSWDKRLLEHMMPGTPLVEFSTHALARSDRLAAIERLIIRRDRIVNAQSQGLSEDLATTQLMTDSFEQLALVLKRVGDKASLKRLREIIPVQNPEEDTPPNALAPMAALQP